MEVAVSENRTGTRVLPFPIRAAALCIPWDSISSTKLLLLYLNTMDNQCEALQKSLTTGGSGKTHLLSLEGQCIEPVPCICNAQTQDQQGKVWGEVARLFFFSFKTQTSTSSPECSNVFQSVGEVPREAEVNCQKNCGKNKKVVCQVQT